MLWAFIKDTDIRINYSAWHKRLAKEGFAEFMREIAMYLINHMYTQHLKAEGLLKQFDDIHIQDGSSMSINDLLKNIFPGRFTKTAPAAIELHVYFSLRYGSFHGVDLAPETVSEYKFMPKAAEYRLANTLSLFDRGYNSLDYLHEIEQVQGFFLVRMKENMTPRVLWANHKDQRRDTYFRNKPLQKIKLNRCQNYDFNVVFDKKKNSNACESLPYGIR